MGKPGKILVCATPIGNLEDVTLRVLKALRACDIIFAEDTRKAKILLSRYNINPKKLVSLHKYNEGERVSLVIKEAKKGKVVCLVSEAGMPAISDPGAYVIAKAWEEGIKVEVLPGPCAVITALVASGLPTGKFVFEGFLPSTRQERVRVLKRLKYEPRTVVVFEAPHRLLGSLKDMLEVFGPDRKVAIARELTKLHEEVIRGRLADVVREVEGRGNVKGEVTVVIEGAGEEAPSKEEIAKLGKELAGVFGPARAAAEISRLFGIRRAIAYRLIIGTDVGTEIAVDRNDKGVIE